MSFLLPLFLVGVGAIAAPIVFHLIRREAKGEQVFSSLMFLEASPPTMMRRSRIDHWLLLLLRSLAVLLLVAAFARPFVKSNSSEAVTTQAKRIAIVIDRSASMARDGLWSSTVAKAKEIIENSPTEHIVCLYAFDDRVQPIVSIENAEGRVPSERKALLLESLKSLTLTQKPSDLGQALASISDELSRDELGDDADESIQSEIILISDFQAGSRIDRLENHQWPAGCRLVVERVESTEKENVSAAFLDEPESDTTPVRLVHRGEQAQLKIGMKWLDDRLTDIEIPRDDGVIVRLAKSTREASILELQGDQSTFDNRRWLAKPPQRLFQLICIDDQERPTAENLGYFLEQIPFSNNERKVEFVWRKSAATEALPGIDKAPLIVASRRLGVGDGSMIRKHLEQGGHFLWVLDTALGDDEATKEFKNFWKILFDGSTPEVTEAPEGREALFGKIDFLNSPFRSLSDSRFNDFTKIRFWKHRRLDLTEHTDWHIAASLDDGSPWLAKRELGKGKFWLMTTGWQPSESQFALSSKFVPIIAALFNDAVPMQRSFAGLEVGSRIDVEEGETWFDPNDHEILPEAAKDSARRFIVSEVPGFYRVVKDGNSQTVAVNVPLTESDTRVMEIERLDRLGVITSDKESPSKSLARSIVRKNRELEKEQSLWRWFMLGVLGILVVETLRSRSA